MNCDVRPTSAKTNTSGLSTGTEDTRDEPKKPQGTSERERKHSKPKEEDYSPDRPREEPEDLCGETVAPGGIHDVHECPRNVRNKHGNETNAPSPGRAPGGHIDDQEALQGVKGDPDRASVVEDAKYDGIGPRSVGNKRVVETNASRAIGGAGKMAKASDTMGDEVVSMAQRAAQATTRNESERGC